MPTARGELAEDTVVVPDHAEANRLYDRGAFGRWSHGDLHLDLLEAAYLVEDERLEVPWPGSGSPMAVRDLIAYRARSAPGFETDYLAYRAFRTTSVTLRHRDDGRFDGYERGTHPDRQTASMLIEAVPETGQTTPVDLLDLVQEGIGLGRQVLVSIVDEESDVTHYEVDEAHIRGEVADPAPEVADHASARLLDDRAILFEGPGLAEAGYGNTVGHETFLSLWETYHLAQHGMDLVDAEGQSVGPGAVLERASRANPEAQRVLAAYAWLREHDLIPKTALKYGVHFRVYKAPMGQAHAPFLVHALADGATWTYQELARFLRLAHSVNKRPVLWSQAGAVTFEWTKP